MGEFQHGVELARRLGDTWVQYAHEFMASVDARSTGVSGISIAAHSGMPTRLSLSERCGWFSDVRGLLTAAMAAGEYAIPAAARRAVHDVPDHIRDTHPEYWHLFFDDPGPAANALQDQLDAVRREATERFGPVPDHDQ